MFYGEKVKLIRKAKRIALNDVAAAMEKHRKTIWAWETGMSTPSPTEVKALAKLLDVKIEKISDVTEASLIAQKIPRPSEITKDDFKHLTAEDQIRIESIQDSLTNAKIKIQSLKADIENYKTIIATVQPFVYVKDKKLLFTYANPGFLAFFKMSNSILGKTNKNIFPAEEARELDLLEQQVLEGKPIYNFKVKILGANGATGLFSGRPIVDAITNDITGITVSIEEITERINAISKYTTLETAINSIKDVLWIGKGSLLGNEYISDAVEKLSGYPKEQFFSNPEFWANNIIHPEDALRVASYYKNEVFSKPLEYRIITKDGDLKHVSEEIDSLGENNLFFSLIRDITGEKEQKVEEEYLNEALGNINSMFWVAKETNSTVKAYEYITLTGSVEKIVGCSKLDFLEEGRNAWIKTVHPSHKEMADIHLEDFKEEQFPLQLEYKIIKKKRVRGIKEYIYKKNGMFFGLTTDITGYKNKSSKVVIKHK